MSGVVADEEISDTTLSLQSVLSAVKNNDFRPKQLEAESEAFLSEAQAAASLPDPTIFATMQGLPVDTFNFDQEPMTQFRLGIRQMFPKGDSLDIKSDLLTLQSDAQQIASELRWLDRKKQSEQAWLETWYWQRYLDLLREDQVFLEQVQGFIRSLYEVGARDQSDLIGADLELLRLSEKRLEARRQFQKYRQQLNTLANEKLGGARVSEELPDLQKMSFERIKTMELESLLAQHPQIRLLDQKTAQADRTVDLVAQEFKPAWGVEISYGFRDSRTMDGSSRPDLLYAGVSVQVPFFSASKQRQNQTAAVQRSGAAELRRDEAFSQMQFEVENLFEQYSHIDQQLQVYEQGILPALEKQVASALQSYESDQGDFQQVMTLFLQQQNAKTLHQRLRANRQQLISSLNYLLGLEHARAQTGADLK